MSVPRGPLPLVPLLPVSDDRVDADVLATWHLALSNALAPDLPHDLLAIWLYTPTGPVLLAPEALAADGLTPPAAEPYVDLVALDAFAQVFVAARYRSTLCQPVAYGRGDVALIVLADLRSDLDTPERRAMLLEVSRTLAPTLARLARASTDQGPSPAGHGSAADAAALLLALSRTMVTEASIGGVLRALFAVLGQTIPHDAAEVIIPGAVQGMWLRLSAHARGSLWQQRQMVVGADVLVPLGLLDPATAAYAPAIDPSLDWSQVLPGLHVAPASAVVVPLLLEGRTIGRLILTAPDRELYGPREQRILSDIAPFLAARVEGLVRLADFSEARSQMASVQAVPAQLHRLTTILATSHDVAAALRDVVAEATVLLPFNRVRFAIRLGAPDRVAYVLPGEHRSFADLPQAPIGGSPLESVLLGQRPHATIDAGADREWIFPLRVSGETLGALLMVTSVEDRLSNMQVAIAQQLADLLAPYLELQRRPYARAPFAVGWKRSPSLPDALP
jgi:hypothetical protein